MRKVKITPDNINDFYQKVNELIDSYFESWSIKPSSLKRYLKKGSIGLKKFIDRNDLGDIERIEKIILDVVEDRYGMEKDNVMKFESFSESDWEEDFEYPDYNGGIDSYFFNHPIFEGLTEPDINFEKSICDKYRVSLGHVEKGSVTRTYEINLKNRTMKCVVFSTEDFKLMITNLKNIITDRLYKQNISMKDINFEVEISKILKSKEEILNQINVGEEDVLKVVSDLLQNEGYDYNGDFKGYYFWIE